MSLRHRRNPSRWKIHRPRRPYAVISSGHHPHGPKKYPATARRRWSGEVRRTFSARPLFGRIGPYFRGKPRQTECTKCLPPTRALARTRTQHSTLCTPARPRPDWEITGGFVGPSSVGAGRIGGTGRSGRAPLRLEVSTIQSSSQGPVCKARPKAPYTMQKLVPKPDRATASLVGDFPRPGPVWAMPTRTRSVDHGLARPPKILCVSRDTLVVGGHF